MQTKTFEICDAGTFIPVLAVRLNPTCEQDRYLIARAGYGTFGAMQAGYVIVVKLDGCEASYDPGRWPHGRTMEIAHRHIVEHFDDLPSGAVVDVEYIMGKTTRPKVSEAETGRAYISTEIPHAETSGPESS